MCDHVLGSRFNVTTKRKEFGVCSSMMMQERVQVRAKENIFAAGKTSRISKRVHNTWSSEQAGTCGTIMHEARFENSYIHITCKSRKKY